ncbi:MAG TPA: hypothetical protein VNS60_09005 [Solirubrobacterales bacterium]|nr:hypothetical protein [Solirubrobacterales bacterium]
MSKDPLAGCVAKIQRAQTHFDALNAEIDSFGKSKPDPYRFVSKVNVKSSRYLMRIKIDRAPPLEWALIAGDFVQNLRAALDHLIWPLARANGYPQQSGHAFPIFDARPPVKRGHPQWETWNRMLAGVHPAAIRFIDLCQPYQGGDGPGRRNLLAALRRLSNEDKHRNLLPAFAAVGASGELDLKIKWSRDIETPLEGGELRVGRPLDDGDVVFEAPVVVTGSDPAVQLEGKIPLDIAFGRRPASLEGLEQMGKAVSYVVRRSRSFLGE